MRSKFEIRAQRELEVEGYFVDWKLRPSMPSPHYNTDYWNLFDLAAWKPGELLFISIKGKTCPKLHKDHLKLFKVPKGVRVELWMFDKQLEDKRKIRKKVFVYA
jgi:hypothetical protein